MAEALSTNHIKLIFAVTKDNIKPYMVSVTHLICSVFCWMPVLNKFFHVRLGCEWAYSTVSSRCVSEGFRQCGPAHFQSLWRKCNKCLRIPHLRDIRHCNFLALGTFQRFFYPHQELSSTIVLEHHKVPPGIKVTYDSQCSDGTHSQGQKRGACSRTMINEQVPHQCICHTWVIRLINSK